MSEVADGVGATAPFEGSIPSVTRTLTDEICGLESLRTELQGQLGRHVTTAVDLIRSSRGRVIVTGMGKSGHIGQKLASTFASTGTPAFFVHPGEASHGDLGMITGDDVILALSWSGETVELQPLVTYSRRFKVSLVSMTSNSASALGRASDIVLELPKAKEACPHRLAPTTSTTMQLALGDSLAIALLESRGFTAIQFKVFHPGGSLGAQLMRVGDLMQKGDSLPLVGPKVSMSSALVTMTSKAFGCLGVVDETGRLEGVITDGDLRRHMSKDLLSRGAGEIMTRNPKITRPDVLVSEALEAINAARITALFVVEDGRPIGIVHVHDLLRIGVA